MARARKFIMLAGERESGKSTDIKALLSVRNERKIILDSSRQPAWKHLPEIPLDWVKKQFTGTYVCYEIERYREFFQILRDHWGSKEGVKLGGTGVAEDFGAVMKEKKEEDVYAMLIGLRHINQDFIGVGHAVKDIPRYIFPQINELILHRTADSWDQIADRFPDRVRDKARVKFDKVQKHPNKYHREIITINETGTKIW